MMNNSEIRLKCEGLAYLVMFATCIPAANFLVQNIGTECVPDGPCLIPVAPGVTAPSGVLMVGLALVLRDLLQRRLGLWWSAIAILVGSGLSVIVAPPALVVASAVAFLLSELADLLVFTPLQRNGLVRAAAVSSAVGAIVDSVVFLGLAFGSLEYLMGQVIGKMLMVVVTMPLLAWLRMRDQRLGVRPA